MGTKLNTKKIVLISIVLSGFMILGLFQNCSSTGPKKFTIKKVPSQLTVPAPSEQGPADRAPANTNFNDMIQANEREIARTRRSIDADLNKAGGGSRGLATKEEAESEAAETVMIETNDKIKLKLRAKRVRPKKK
ncbi:MAG: hypothetical protein H7061_08070 [Bdellovibrionaceae bacterium]|nr:hypothetical protein [Bdellovibrio sp.]